MTQLRVDRDAILAYRRRAQSLDRRLPAGRGSLRRAASAGLQDSMPRAALLSIHARVAGTSPDTLDDPSLVQVWGPRYSVYVVAADDVAPFTLGRLPEGGHPRERADAIAAQVATLLGDGEMLDRDAGPALGIHPNAIRYAAPTGTILVRWDGARAPSIRMGKPPSVDPSEARAELARRYLHAFGPTTADSFAGWAGIRPPAGRAAFEALAPELTAVRTPIGEGLILAADEGALRVAPGTHGGVRLLPSGDTYFLLWGAERELLVPEADRRAQLWTSRVWPGALLVDGEIVGTWRRAGGMVIAEPWRRLSTDERTAIETEAAALPLPGLGAPIEVRWPS